MHWKLILLLLSTHALAAAPASAPFSNSDYSDHIKQLRARLPDGFAIVVEKPFVVISDDSAANLKQYATGTVRWAVEHLRKDYFDKDPDELIDIYLFKDSA